MVVKVKAPGSCGELVQGTINGQNFLITCPIDLYSQVDVALGAKAVCAGVKTITAVEKTLALFQSKQEYSVFVSSKLPCGKGMASSSADIAAACQATALSLGRALSEQEIATIALSIEPTDGIFYQGIVMFDHVRGRMCQQLGNPPPMHIAVFDVGGEVDTLNFNQRIDLAILNQAKEVQVKEAVNLVTEGLRRGDSRLIGRGATISAQANQIILNKPCLDDMIKIIALYQAVGVTVAHSGTVLGILFDSNNMALHDACIAKVQSLCPKVEYLFTRKLISGGLMIL